MVCLFHFHAMTTNTSDHLKDILLSIDELAKRANISRQRAFAAWYAENFFDVDEDDALEGASLDGGEDQGIDLVFADEATKEIFIIQAHCPENFDKKTDLKKWTGLVGAIPFYENPENFIEAGRPEMAKYIAETKLDREDYQVTFMLISLAKANDSVSRQQKATTRSKTFNKYSYIYQAQADIVNRYATLIASEKSIPEDSIEFVSGYIEDTGKYGRSWIGSVSASELIRLHSTYKNQLFSGNVRFYLGARKGGINEQIVKTAKNNPGSFWALNNGISIVANSVDPIDNNSLQLKRFSIVNGCQTTSCLVQANAPSEAKVLVRVIAATPSTATDIVRFNNSQNAVKIWAVRSVDETQERLRSDFDKIGIKYAPKQEGSKKKRDAGNIIELDKLTQYLAASHVEYLIQSINNKAELFDQPYQKLYPHDARASDIFLAWKIGTISDEVRQDWVAQRKQSTGFDKQSSALLGVSGTHWIAYCCHKIIDALNKSDIGKIPIEKINTSEMNSVITKYAAEALDIYFDIAIDTYDEHEYGSIRSALRSPRFLEKFNLKLQNKLQRVAGKRLPKLLHASKSSR